MVKVTAEGRTNLLIFVEPPPNSRALIQRSRTRMQGGVGERARHRASLPDVLRLIV